MTKQAEIEKLILSCVADQTFTANALKRFEGVIDESRSLDETNKKLASDIKHLELQKSRLEGDVKRGIATIKKWSDRETELSEREMKMVDLEKRTAIAEAVNTQTTKIMDAMLGNRIVRENLQHSVPVAVNMGGHNPDGSYTAPDTIQHETTSKTIETEEG